MCDTADDTQPAAMERWANKSVMECDEKNSLKIVMRLLGCCTRNNPNIRVYSTCCDGTLCQQKCKKTLWKLWAPSSTRVHHYYDNSIHPFFWKWGMVVDNVQNIFNKKYDIIMDKMDCNHSQTGLRRLPL